VIANMIMAPIDELMDLFGGVTHDLVNVKIANYSCQMRVVLGIM